MVLETPNRNRQAERREATRREIIDAAWAVARETGLAELTLRDVADRVGMRPPSLYSHFASKLAIYDAMFGAAWTDYERQVLAGEAQVPTHPRAAARWFARQFFDYAVADLPRHQLMNQRIIPGFEPSAEAYAPAVRVLEHGRAQLAALGVPDQDDFDIWVSIIGGLINQQHANDPGGNRFAHLLDRAIDMWADAIGLPAMEASPHKRAGTRK